MGRLRRSTPRELDSCAAWLQVSPAQHQKSCFAADCGLQILPAGSMPTFKFKPGAPRCTVPCTVTPGAPSDHTAHEFKRHSSDQQAPPSVSQCIIEQHTVAISMHNDPQQTASHCPTVCITDHPTHRQPGPCSLTDTVMTPSLPTFSMALAMSSPISRSPLAEMVATCRGSSRFW